MVGKGEVCIFFSPIAIFCWMFYVRGYRIGQMISVNWMVMIISTKPREFSPYARGHFKVFFFSHCYTQNILSLTGDMKQRTQCHMLTFLQPWDSEDVLCVHTGCHCMIYCLIKKESLFSDPNSFKPRKILHIRNFKLTYQVTINFPCIFGKYFSMYFKENT